MCKKVLPSPRLKMVLAEGQKEHFTLTYLPLLSIDDFGVHLDEERSALLLHEAMNLGQVFLTTPHSSQG